jgi:hypothetical protein
MPSWLGRFPFWEVCQMATVTLTTTRLLEAVDLVRRYRHHQDCVCGLYRSPNDHAPFCSRDEWRWSTTVDRLLSSINSA